MPSEIAFYQPEVCPAVHGDEVSDAPFAASVADGKSARTLPESYQESS